MLFLVCCNVGMSSKNQVSVNYILKWNELQEFCFTDGVAACCCVTGKPASPDMELVAGSEMDENGSPKQQNQDCHQELTLCQEETARAGKQV